MGRDDIERALEQAGAAPTPSPSPSFVTALEARLRATTSTGSAPAGVVPIRRRSAWAPLVAAAAIVVVLAAIVGVLGRQSTEVAAPLRLAAATDTVVVYPDGRREVGRAGLVLSEGAVLSTGAAGRAVAGGVVIGPGETAIVSGGRVSPLPTPARPAPTSTSVTRRPAITVPPLGATTTTAGPSRPPSNPPAAPPPAAGGGMTLVVKDYDQGTALRWSSYEGDGFARYVVLRAPAPDDPNFPPGASPDDRTENVACRGMDLSDRSQGACYDPAAQKATATASPRWRYLIVAVDGNGRELGRSNVAAAS
jgi:hypothetical protein